MLDGQSADAACKARPDQPSSASVPDGQSAEARPDQPSPALVLDGQGAEGRPDQPSSASVPDGQSAEGRPDQPSPALVLDGQGAEGRPDQPSPALVLDGQGAEVRPDQLKPFYVYKPRKARDLSAIDRKLFIDPVHTASDMHPCLALQTSPDFYAPIFEDLDEALLYRKMYNQAKPGHRMEMYEAIVSGEVNECASGEGKEARVRRPANIHNVSTF